MSCFTIRTFFIGVRLILTWRTRARRLEGFIVSRVAVSGTSVCFGLGTPHFAFTSIGCGAWTFVSAREVEDQELETGPRRATDSRRP